MVDPGESWEFCLPENQVIFFPSTIEIKPFCTREKYQADVINWEKIELMNVKDLS